MYGEITTPVYMGINLIKVTEGVFRGVRGCAFGDKQQAFLSWAKENELSNDNFKNLTQMIFDFVYLAHLYPVFIGVYTNLVGCILTASIPEFLMINTSASCDFYEVTLKNLFELRENSSILNRTNRSERHSSSDEEPLSSPKNSFNRSRRGYRDLGQIILNWKLSFSGENVLSADSFLDKIEYRRRLTEVSDEELLMAMPVLLDGMALRWFDIHEHEFTTWKRFKKELRNRFGDDDFDRRIREQIQVTRQGKDESMDDYLTNLQGLIKHLHDEVPMVEQLDWAHRGLRPKYHQVISRSDFRSFRELSRLGKNLEKQ